MTEMGNQESLTVDSDAAGTIVVHGDVDVAGGPLLETAILHREKELRNTDAAITIDLADVFFIDSSGLRTLLSASRRAVARGGRVVLRNVGAEVHRLLEITATAAHFSIESTRG